MYELNLQYGFNHLYLTRVLMIARKIPRTIFDLISNELGLIKTKKYEVNKQKRYYLIKYPTYHHVGQAKSC
jgi:hypothetical protein